MTEEIKPAEVEGRFASVTTEKIDAAIIKLQKTYVPPFKSKDVVAGPVRYSYAPLTEVIESLRKPLTDVGIWFSQFIVGPRRLRTIVYHESGEWIATDFPIYATNDRGTGFASGCTFARRYGILLALGVSASEEEDDDGARANQAAPSPTPMVPRASNDEKAGRVLDRLDRRPSPGRTYAE